MGLLEDLGWGSFTFQLLFLWVSISSQRERLLLGFLFADLELEHLCLLPSYGWKVSNLGFGGICLLCVFFGALMQPTTALKVCQSSDQLLQWQNITEDDEYDQKEEQDKEENKNLSRLDAENKWTRRERRLSERRMSSNRMSRNYSATYLQQVRHDSIILSTSNKS